MIEDLAVHWSKTSILELWHKQLLQHHKESYKGIGLAKFPQDLWTYEKLIHDANPDVIIEIGTNKGGFTRWLHDRLICKNMTDNNTRDRCIVGLDIDIKASRHNLQNFLDEPIAGVTIKLIECDLLIEDSTKSAVEQIQAISHEKSILIIEDSGHTYQTTKSALNSFSTLLNSDEWFIVEDTCVDIEGLREYAEWPKGALTATNEFLAENPEFERSDFNHAYGITCHPFGFLHKK